MTPIEIIFTIIFLSGPPIWFFLGWRVFKMLKMKYPDIYDQLGGNRRLIDRMLKEETSADTLSLLLLIFSTHKELNDVELSKLCKVMQFVFIIYIILFAYLIYYVWRLPKFGPCN